MFSPTSPTRIHGHPILNIRQSEAFEDLKQVVLHTMFLVPDPLVGHCNTYGFVCVAMGTMVGWRKEYSMENIPLAFFFEELDKCEPHVARAHLPLPPMQDAHS
jgi:hypothetical protein